MSLSYWKVKRYPDTYPPELLRHLIEEVRASKYVPKTAKETALLLTLSLNHGIVPRQLVPANNRDNAKNWDEFHHCIREQLQKAGYQPDKLWPRLVYKPGYMKRLEQGHDLCLKAVNLRKDLETAGHKLRLSFPPIAPDKNGQVKRGDYDPATQTLTFRKASGLSARPLVLPDGLAAQVEAMLKRKGKKADRLFSGTTNSVNSRLKKAQMRLREKGFELPERYITIKDFWKAWVNQRIDYYMAMRVPKRRKDEPTRYFSEHNAKRFVSREISKGDPHITFTKEKSRPKAKVSKPKPSKVEIYPNELTSDQFRVFNRMAETGKSFIGDLQTDMYISERFAGRLEAVKTTLVELVELGLVDRDFVSTGSRVAQGIELFSLSAKGRITYVHGFRELGHKTRAPEKSEKEKMLDYHSTLAHAVLIRETKTALEHLGYAVEDDPTKTERETKDGRKLRFDLIATKGLQRGRQELRIECERGTHSQNDFGLKMNKWAQINRVFFFVCPNQSALDKTVEKYGLWRGSQPNPNLFVARFITLEHLTKGCEWVELPEKRGHRAV